MATHSSVLAWRIPGTGEPGGLPDVSGVAQNRTRLKRLSSSSSSHHELFSPVSSISPKFKSRRGLTKTCVAASAAKLLQSCPTLCDPRDGSPPGSPVPGILQARTLKWVAISFSISSSHFVRILHYDPSIGVALHGMAPTPVLLPGKSHGWRSLVGCSPWGR